MNLADLSIRRPIFITCLIVLMLAVGALSLKKLPVNLFPDVTFPIVTVSTVYPGAAPKEVETLVSKIYEEELSTITGLKSLKSINKENISIVVAEFSLETDVKYAEQQVRDRVAAAKRKLPNDTEEAIIRRVDPADQPILAVALTGKLEDADLFDIADLVVRPKFEQVNKVGLVEVIGGRKREIKVELDRKKLQEHDISATLITNRLAIAGQNVPAGKVDQGNKTETVFRTVGEFRNLKEISDTIVNFVGNDVPVTIKDVASVSFGLQDQKSVGYYNGSKTIVLNIYRQSGANTIEVAKSVMARIEKINEELKTRPGSPNLLLVRDGSKAIADNVLDVKESIILGIILTVLVVYFFLGSGRSTLITGLALPNSLIGSFILMAIFGFSFNIMTLLALSLSVGLLIDDAIVVRENIFRHIEMGKDPRRASLEGTKEVTLAVLATTLTILAVFGPIAFLKGVVGQFFKEFGLSICFIMIISTFDALTIAPMLSTYFAGKHIEGEKRWFLLEAFNRFQNKLEDIYEKLLKFSLKKPFIILIGALVIFILSLVSAKFIPKTFLPPQDNGEFSVSLDMPPGTSLDEMNQVAIKVDTLIRSYKEVQTSVLTVGNRDGESNIANFYINLVPKKQRALKTFEFKDKLRDALSPFLYAKPAVKDFDAVGGGQRPFNVSIIGQDLDQIQKISEKLFDFLKVNPSLKDVDLSYRPGKPEFQVIPWREKAELLGVSTGLLGLELRTLIEGQTPAVFRQKGEEYDIRVRLQDDQRNLKEGFGETYVPNVNGKLVKLSSVARPVETTGPATIGRQDRSRYYTISADIASKGKGMGGVMQDVRDLLDKEIKLPQGVSYRFEGQAENFVELVQNMLVAMGLGILFIYLVLASLYESFVTPFTIMLVLPLAICGALYALLITGAYLDLFSMIGCVMLLGVATKNSILLVDYSAQLIAEGMPRDQAIIKAGKTRLRPILMTSFALIAGMIPIAIGLNEASAQRTGLGIAVIGGAISSTFLSLLVVPASFSYIERFRFWSLAFMKKIFGVSSGD